MKDPNWLRVDRKGLAKLLEARGKSFAVYEIIQNAWDTRATNVQVKLTREPGRHLVNLLVEDNDPDGFQNLSESFTLFAESSKKSDAMKRGRFNLGEKLVLALCERAEITSTKGGVVFSKNGIKHTRKKLDSGTIFYGLLRMSVAEFNDCHRDLQNLIPPQNIVTMINGVKLNPWLPLKKFEVTLPTVLGDEEGVLRPTRRRTQIEVYEVQDGEAAMIYEMGIPIVETGDAYHVNVLQKVPLNSDRDNVTPAYLREVRTAVLSQMHDTLSETQATATWAREALPGATDEAITSVLRKRFGEKIAAADPSDREAENRLKAEGYVIVHGGSLTGPEWKRIKEVEGLLPPAGILSPTHSKKTAETHPVVDLTPGMETVKKFVEKVGKDLLSNGLRGLTVKAAFVSAPKASCAATWQVMPEPLVGGTLTFNVGTLGIKWFDRGITDPVLELIIHELGHHFASNHLSEAYYDGLCVLGVRLARAIEANPNLLSPYQGEQKWSNFSGAVG